MRKRRKDLKKSLTGRTIRTWFAAFAVSFTVQLACGLLATEAVSRTMRIQTNEAYGNALNVLSSSCDNDLNAVWSMLSIMVLDEDVKKRCDATASSGRNLPYQNELVRRQLTSYKVQHSFIDDIFIYFEEAGQIVSSNTVADADLFYDIYGDVGMSFEEWEEALARQYYKSDVLWENRSGTETLYILHSWVRTDEETVTIAVKFKDSYIQELADRFRGDRFAVIAIRNEAGQLIAESGNTGDEASGQRVSQTSELTGWTYTAYVSEEGIRLYGGSTLVLLVICFTSIVIASAAAFLLFFRTNVNPFRELTQYINSQSQEEIVSGSEYLYIKDKFDEIVSKQKADERQFENQMNLLKVSYLTQILNGKIAVDSGNRQLLEKMQLEWLYGPCAVLLISDGDSLLKQPENCMAVLEAYGIGMSRDSLLYGCSFLHGALLVCLFRPDAEERELKSRIAVFAGTLRENRKAGEEGVIAVSSLSGGDAVDKRYGQAQYVMQSARQLGVSGVLFFDEIQERIRENARDSKDDGLVQQVRDYIEAHYAEPELTIELLCSRLGKSVSYLSRIYKERTGQNILYELNLVRVEKAKQLLREEEISVDEIGRRVGFSGSNSFIRVFKKYEHMTPGRYKELYLAGMY